MPVDIEALERTPPEKVALELTGEETKQILQCLAEFPAKLSLRLIVKIVGQFVYDEEEDRCESSG